MTSRTVLFLVATAALAGAVVRGGPPLSLAVEAAAVAAVAAVLALGSRSGGVLRAWRRPEARALVVDAAPPFRLWRGAAVAVGAGAAVGAAAGAASHAMVAASASGRGPGRGLAVAAAVLVAGLVAQALASRSARSPGAPRTTTPGRHLLIDTALPAAVSAAVLGVAVSALRLPTVVDAVEVSRHFAVTAWAAAFLIGAGGGIKVFTELSTGRVVWPATASSLPALPGPVPVGGVAGVVLLLVLPRVLEPVPLGTFWVAKAAFAFFLSLLLSVLGGLRGAARARGELR